MTVKCIVADFVTFVHSLGVLQINWDTLILITLASKRHVIVLCDSACFELSCVKQVALLSQRGRAMLRVSQTPSRVFY